MIAPQRLTVHVDGTPGAVTLAPSDHVATGGEGAVYLKGGAIYKIYLDPDKAAARGIEDKLAWLQRLRHPSLAVPTAALRNKAGRFVGVAMPHVPGQPLCTLFSTPGRDRAGFDWASTVRAVQSMREALAHVHAHGALTVDGNELNWLIEGDRPVAIDADGWQTPGHPATAIMPSIRDPNVNAQTGFTTGSDWFAWGVVTFQLWTGIHPYKGNHPAHGSGKLEQRMQARASVFDAGVKLPAPTRAFDHIPVPLKDWYAKTFSTAERTPPPSVTAAAPVAASAVSSVTVHGQQGRLSLERLSAHGGPLVPLGSGFVWDRSARGQRLIDALANPPEALDLPDAWFADLGRGRCAVGRLGDARLALRLDLATQTVTARHLGTGDQATAPTRASRLWHAKNRWFALVDGDDRGLHEIDPLWLNNRLVLGFKQAWPVVTLSSRFFRDVLVHDAMGAPFVGVITADGLSHHPAPSLKGLSVADGMALGNRHVWLTATDRQGNEVRVRLALENGRFVEQERAVVDDLALDAACTATGVAAIRSGGDLWLFKGDRAQRLDWPNAFSKLRLFDLGEGMGALDESRIHRLRVVA